MKLRLEIKSEDMWDDQNECFVTPVHKVVNLEHSLYTISLWEEKHHKAFLSQETFTPEELIDYIRLMSDENLDEYDLEMIVKNHMKDIESFMNDSATAVTFRDFEEDDKKDKKIVASEMLYWQMFHYNIPLEFQHWHLQRLITLLRVCQDKEGDVEPKKMSQQYRKQLNESRRKKYKSKG